MYACQVCPGGWHVSGLKLEDIVPMAEEEEDFVFLYVSAEMET